MFALKLELQELALARCGDAPRELAALFFSDEPVEIEQAKAFCGGCLIQAACLQGALQRREAAGVWGGQLFQDGKVLPQKRKRGRPPKARPSVDELVAAIA
jgi:WhiB family redox-sensing transcriptional regulator